jgi:hypothetical protein
MTSDSAHPYCTRRGCAHRAHLVARDGRPYCKKHGDRLPPYLRRQPATKGRVSTVGKERTP